jgi:hypothetical protein
MAVAMWLHVSGTGVHVRALERALRYIEVRSLRGFRINLFGKRLIKRPKIVQKDRSVAEEWLVLLHTRCNACAIISEGY